MELNKKTIEWFNKNKSKSKEEYTKLINQYFSNSKKCRMCNNVIYYYDSSFKLSYGKLITIGKSFLSSKSLDKIYKLSICEDCLTYKYPEYQEKNKSRVFNQMNYITEFAFNIPSGDALKWMKEKYAITEENLIKKWGEEIGKQKWKSYREKQSLTNKFEYKKEKYGWTKDKFENYNKSRSITLISMIEKYGENIGLIKWNDYIEKQKTTKSKKYVIDKHGEEFWINQCKSKSHTFEVYLKRYKLENIANEKLLEFYSKLSSPSIVSKSSQMYFEKLDKIIGEKYKTYFYNKNGKEYGKDIGNRWVYLDYFINELNLNIEYNGDLFHGNPDIFGPEDEPIPFNSIKAKDIWKSDEEKIRLLKEKYNIRTIVIWESNLPSIEKLIEIIENG